ncbi:MAG: TauD/TfdA family dioxygenase [Rhodobacterales bacterium]|nr:TauD/TfdA family dioxygenase [Rhodobacterales bacterium]
MANSDIHFPDDSCWNLDDDAAYLAWRRVKLDQASGLVEQSTPVVIGDMGALTSVERAALMARCAVSNGVLYREQTPTQDESSMSAKLRQFANALGLQIAEKHRSAGQDGVVALQVSESLRQKRYIPYSSKKMNWHTDGYYNAPDQKIRAMVLHCVRAANDGGVNQFLDNEIAYIRLRDENPDYIRALMHPQAMTIPANEEPDGDNRPASIGPVFAVDPLTDTLEMRYTARTRSIAWRDDAATRAAVDFLTGLLGSDDPLIQTVKMQAGTGILCNNSLHNRTGFDGDTPENSARLMMRVRFHNRISKD